VVLVAPKGPGALVRREYEIGRGVPSVYASTRTRAATPSSSRWPTAPASAARARTRSRPPSRKKPKPTCSASRRCCAAARPSWCRPAGKPWSKPATSRKSPTTKCLHELKLIVDLFYEGGITRMHEFISETAQYGALTRGDYIVDANTRAQMKKVLTEIQDGTFARQWIAEYAAGNANYKAMKQADLDHPIEASARSCAPT
jgi:ketol-acid reductoisomerase